MESPVKSNNMIQIYATIGTIVVALIGGYFSQSSRTDTRIETAKAEQNASVLQISQRITAVETDTVSIKEDLKEIKGDVKSLIKLLK